VDIAGHDRGTPDYEWWFSIRFSY